MKSKQFEDPRYISLTIIKLLFKFHNHW